jgi:hypothetical protein
MSEERAALFDLWSVRRGTFGKLGPNSLLNKFTILLKGGYELSIELKGGAWSAGESEAVDIMVEPSM